jgi:cation transport regulator ChaB
MIDRKTGKVIPGMLRNLKLAELSGCHVGANQHARVVLIKTTDGEPLAKKYAGTADLPEAVRNALPAGAQRVFLRVANRVMSDPDATEESAFKQAWAAVKNGWAKNEDGAWVRKAGAVESYGEKEDDDDPDDAAGKKKGKKKLPWMKADAIAKAMYGGIVEANGGTGAVSFRSLLAQNEERRREWAAHEKLYPLFDALRDSIQRIAADHDLPTGAKMIMARESVQDFMDTVAAEMPNVEQELVKLLKESPAFAGFYEDAGGDPSGTTSDVEKENIMDVNKQLADLQTQVTQLTKSLEAATAKVTELEAAKTKAEADLATEKAAHAALTKSVEIAKTDETILIKQGDKDVTVRKSEVGDGAWAMFKSQQERIEKAEAERTEVVFTKRAETELSGLKGTVLEKGKALLAIETSIKDEPTRKTVMEMLKSGVAAMSQLMTSTGQDPNPNLDGTDPISKLNSMAKAKSDAEKIDFHKAYSEVLATSEGQALYAEYTKMTAPRPN